ncbi:MAG: hypothetical protein R3F09_15200 [Burkholderiaceae bacterium]
MRLKSVLARAGLALLLLQGLLLAPAAVQAQQNSQQAAEAARKYRAEKAQGNAPAPQRANAAAPSSPTGAYRSSANPNADPSRSLKSCMDHAGMSPMARDRCMRQHCEGRWGQGDCPAGSDFMANKGASNTPLGHCLAEAGGNPFKRDACGWKHCRNSWDTPECAAIKPRSQPLAN